MNVGYSVYRVSDDGLLKVPEVEQAYYAPTTSMNPYDNKEDAVRWIEENGAQWVSYAVVEEYSKGFEQRGGDPHLSQRYGRQSRP